MTIKINDLDRWRLLPAGKVASFTARNQRRVRLHVNVSAETPLMIQRESGELRLLAYAPPGLSTVEFITGGNFGVYPERDDVELWYQTSEDEPTAVEGLGETFTRIHQRGARNLELEKVMFIQEQNMKRREATFMAQIERLMKGKDDGSGIYGGAAPKHKEPSKPGNADVDGEGGAGGGAEKLPPENPKPEGKPNSKSDEGKKP